MPNPGNLKGKGFDKHPEHINKKGAPRKLPELDKLLAEVFNDKEMIAMIKSLYKSALKGNVRAAEILLDRAYGKAKQSMDLTSGGEKFNPIQIVNDKDSGDV